VFGFNLFIVEESGVFVPCCSGFVGAIVKECLIHFWKCVLRRKVLEKILYFVCYIFSGWW